MANWFMCSAGFSQRPREMGANTNTEYNTTILCSFWRLTVNHAELHYGWRIYESTVLVMRSSGTNEPHSVCNWTSFVRNNNRGLGIGVRENNAACSSTWWGEMVSMICRQMGHICLVSYVLRNTSVSHDVVFHLFWVLTTQKSLEEDRDSAFETVWLCSGLYQSFRGYSLNIRITMGVLGINTALTNFWNLCMLWIRRGSQKQA